MSTTIPPELVYQSTRQDSDSRAKKQYAANVLQQYSFQALHALKHNQSPAKTRLDMMRVMTDLPKSVQDSAQYRKTSVAKQ
ncbi:hypothetical protein BCR42DRAFT_443522 [Absidia repens]|uniref:Uncharacterized protein n=1 Tax=Absidia repens TaxID=90262 RepID=A0A1X2HZ61_9FUNG|nr:hypothetical protein BCR42DRAFT_443522 [Absidia repens]